MDLRSLSCISVYAHSMDHLIAYFCLITNLFTHLLAIISVFNTFSHESANHLSAVFLFLARTRRSTDFFYIRKTLYITGQVAEESVNPLASQPLVSMQVFRARKKMTQNFCASRPHFCSCLAFLFAQSLGFLRTSVCVVSRIVWPAAFLCCS